MLRVKLTKSVIDDLPTSAKDVVYWDSGGPGFGVKVTPAGRKVVLFRTGGTADDRFPRSFRNPACPRSAPRQPFLLSPILACSRHTQLHAMLRSRAGTLWSLSKAS
jgi:hypothetical protein